MVKSIPILISTVSYWEKIYQSQVQALLFPNLIRQHAWRLHQHIFGQIV